jgi:hypothetical protein
MFMQRPFDYYIHLSDAGQNKPCATQLLNHKPSALYILYIIYANKFNLMEYSFLLSVQPTKNSVLRQTKHTYSQIIKNQQMH